MARKLTPKPETIMTFYRPTKVVVIYRDAYLKPTKAAEVRGATENSPSHPCLSCILRYSIVVNTVRVRYNYQ